MRAKCSVLEHFPLVPGSFSGDLSEYQFSSASGLRETSFGLCDGLRAVGRCCIGTRCVTRMHENRIAFDPWLLLELECSPVMEGQCVISPCY